MKQARKRLSRFLQAKKGELTDRQFADQLGLSNATVNRLLNCEQNPTLDTLDHIRQRLRCDIRELFPKS